MTKAGTVYLVGAGPGDIGLLTMRGSELLGRAEVVVYDALVNPELLKFAPKSAEIIYGGKRSRDHAIPQQELNQLLVSKAKEGKTVVRLKGGDPYIFGRGAEEVEELAAAGIRFEVVPGISSIVAAPNYAGIPLTHRAHCSSFTVVTGHEDPAKETTATDWAAIAKVPGTKVILMGVEKIGQIAETLIKSGLPETTPIAMIRWGTTGKQESITATLKTIGEMVARTKFSAPAVTVIGGVVTLREKLNWFEKKLLFGQRIVVSRTRDQASHLVRLLLERGASVSEIPTIRIEPPDNKTALTDAILSLHEYDWVVFTSPNGVTTFFEYFFKAFDDLRDIGGVRIAAVGPSTAAKLKELHLRVDVMPQEYLAVNITKAIAGFESIENLRILLMRAEVANRDLPEALEALGGIVDDVACYKTVPETDNQSEGARQLLSEGADWITFTSSSTVENFHARFDLPGLLRKFPKMQTASIGPETTKALVKLDITRSTEAKKHTVEGLVEAIEQKVKSEREE